MTYCTMPKRSKQEKRHKDANQLAQYLVTDSTRERGVPDLPTQAQISLLMADLGRKGGKIGGKRRLQTMTAAERKKIAKKAADARWGKTKNKFTL